MSVAGTDSCLFLLGSLQRTLSDTSDEAPRGPTSLIGYDANNRPEATRPGITRPRITRPGVTDHQTRGNQIGDKPHQGQTDPT